MAIKAGPKDQDVQFAKLPRSGAVEFAELTTGPLYVWQRELLPLLCGEERPRVAYIQIGRKQGKSRLAASFALNEMCNKDYQQIFLIADSERNLKSALFFELCTLVRRSPILSQAVLIYKDHLECPSTGGAIHLRPNNLSASQSINPNGVVFDEVHMQRTDSIWNGMVLAGAADPNAILLGITTPGYDTTSLAHGLYDQVKAGALWGRIYEPVDPGCALDDPAAILQANPALLDRPDMASVFEFERANMPAHDYRRFRLGQWTETANAWLPYGAWEARKVPSSLNLGDRVWLGFDGSHSGDSTALVACNELGHLTILNVWEKPVNRSNLPWRVPRQEVLDAVDRAFADFDVQAMHGDPPYWNREFQEWDQAYPSRVIEFPWASPAKSGPACSAFYAAVMDGKLSHDGDIRLGRHVANAVNRPTPHGVVIEKWNKDSPRRIDLAVAAVMAYHGLATGLAKVKPVTVW